MSSDRDIVEAIKFKLAQEKRASLPPIVDKALMGLFGHNRIPDLQNGESVYSTMLDRDRNLEAMDLQGEAFATNPALNFLGVKNNKASRLVGSLAGDVIGDKLSNVMGGNPARAAKNLHESLGPQAMGNFGKLGPASKSETNDAMKALVRNFHRNEASEADGNAKTSSEKLIGGEGDNKPDKAFNSEELKKGVKHEREHTKDKRVAREIAKDHLSERGDYYTALAKTNIEK
jgi:hypothetical protein